MNQSITPKSFTDIKDGEVEFKDGTKAPFWAASVAQAHSKIRDEYGITSTDPSFLKEKQVVKIVLGAHIIFEDTTCVTPARDKGQQRSTSDRRYRNHGSRLCCMAA